MVVLFPNGSTTCPRISSPYGWRTHPVTGVRDTFHYGVDLGHDWDVIKAPVTGTVTFAGYNGGAGNEVRIREDGTGVVYRLFHNRALWVSTGQRVTQGQDVALMGTTGMSTGVHCHFQIEVGGSTVEPVQYVNNRNASTAGGGSTPFGGFLMALSDFQQQQVYDALVAQSPGGSYYKTDALINIARGELAPAIASIAAGGILFPGAGYNAFVALANAIYGVGDKIDAGEPVEIDEAELAASLAPTLAPLLIENAGTLSDDSIQRLVKSLLAEQAARLAKPTAQ